MIVSDNSLKSILSKDFSVENPKSDIMAVIFQTTRAEDVISSIIVENDDKFEEQKLDEPLSEEEHDALRKSFAQFVFDESLKFKSDNLETISFTWRFQNRETGRLIDEDIKNVGFVFVACLIYMIFHTRSVFLAVYSLLNMFMSIPISMFIYKEVFGVKYFSSLHISSIIIIVGIGCDDIFVFHDCWKNALCVKAIRHRPIERMSLVVRKAFM